MSHNHLSLPGTCRREHLQSNPTRTGLMVALMKWTVRPCFDRAESAAVASWPYTDQADYHCCLLRLRLVTMFPSFCELLNKGHVFVDAPGSEGSDSTAILNRITKKTMLETSGSSSHSSTEGLHITLSHHLRSIGQKTRKPSNQLQVLHNVNYGHIRYTQAAFSSFIPLPNLTLCFSLILLTKMAYKDPEWTSELAGSSTLSKSFMYFFFKLSVKVELDPST